MASEPLNKIGSLIRKGAKIFIQHEHQEGYLQACWQGKYHLAYILQGWDHKTNQFTAMWVRNGLKAIQTYCLKSIDQIVPVDMKECYYVEYNDTNNAYLATIADLRSQECDKIEILWQTGTREKIHLSQMFIQHSQRKRTTHNQNSNKIRTIKGLMNSPNVDLHAGLTKDNASITLDEKDAIVRKHGKFPLHGFSTISSSINPIKTVVGILSNIQSYGDDSAMVKDALIDANSILQEILYDLSSKTKFVMSPSLCEKNLYEFGHGNQSIITHLAKHFELNQNQINELFLHKMQLDHNGFFSINDAIPIIVEMRKGTKSFKTNDTNIDVISTIPKMSLLGKRVKTVFENGEEHEGTISSIHYRVHYDDDDQETFSENEVFENLADNTKYFCNEISSSMLEIFSGCSLLSTLCQRKGMKVISIDNDKNSNASIKQDFESTYVQSLLSSSTFDYIHASPECRTYSHLAGTTHRTSENYNVSSKSNLADRVLLMLYFNVEQQLRKNPNCIVTIENPVGYMQKGKVITELFENRLRLKKYKIFYCQFGRDEMKPTCIWTTDYKLGEILIAMGGKCRCKGKHTDSVQDSRDKNFASLPMQLCMVIASYVHSKLTQLKFEKFLENKQSML